MKPQTRQPTDTKNRILQVAEKLFSQKGYDSTGIDEIAAQVGIAKSVIYHHFRNKEDILQTMMNRILQEFQAIKDRQNAVKNIASAAKIDKKYVKALFDQLLQYFESRKRLLKIVLMQSIKDSSFVPLINVLEHEMKSRSGDMVSLSPGEWENILTEEFFMVLMPMISFVVFSDKWSQHFQLDGKKVRQTFTKSFNRFLLDAYLPSDSLVCLRKSSATYH